MSRMKQPSRKPTDAELAILRILWTRGPSTVRDVATEMGREGAYTTVLKLLQIMTDKQLVRRNESARTHIYEAAHSEDADAAASDRRIFSIARSTDRPRRW